MELCFYCYSKIFFSILYFRACLVLRKLQMDDGEVTLHLLGICHLLIKVKIHRRENCVPVGE